jgi:hypothetical protein
VALPDSATHRVSVYCELDVTHIFLHKLTALDYTINFWCYLITHDQGYEHLHGHAALAAR